MNLSQIAAVAVDAQAAVHHLNNASRAVDLSETGKAVRDAHRSRLAVCAEYFAGAAAMNDELFVPSEPEQA
jgi:hypothetical protein